jgi:uncharacterized protein (TIGR03067 family)
MARVALSLAAVLALTAFAPAPFPRAGRGGGESSLITLSTLQGTWRVTGMVRYAQDGSSAPHKWQITGVTVVGDRWTFLRGEAPTNSYLIAIDSARSPATLDFSPPREGGGGISGLGIIRRRGDVVEIVYYFGKVPRAQSFDRPPAGQYLLTLQRQR